MHLLHAGWIGRRFWATARGFHHWLILRAKEENHRSDERSHQHAENHRSANLAHRTSVHQRRLLAHLPKPHGRLQPGYDLMAHVPAPAARCPAP